MKLSQEAQAELAKKLLESLKEASKDILREQVGLEPGQLAKSLQQPREERTISLDIDQCFSNTATDAVVWDAGLVMLHYLARTWSDHFSTYHPLVLELGSGTGVVGLAAAAMGA